MREQGFIIIITTLASPSGTAYIHKADTVNALNASRANVRARFVLCAPQPSPLALFIAHKAGEVMGDLVTHIKPQSATAHADRRFFHT